MSVTPEESLYDAQQRRTCQQRITDRKRSWMWTGVVVTFVFLGIGALLGVAGKSTECIRTDGASLASLVFLGISLSAFVVTTLFGCCASSTEIEWEQAKARALTGNRGVGGA